MNSECDVELNLSCFCSRRFPGIHQAPLIASDKKFLGETSIKVFILGHSIKISEPWLKRWAPISESQTWDSRSKMTTRTNPSRTILGSTGKVVLSHPWPPGHLTNQIRLSSEVEWDAYRRTLRLSCAANAGIIWVRISGRCKWCKDIQWVYQNWSWGWTFACSGALSKLDGPWKDRILRDMTPLSSNNIDSAIPPSSYWEQPRGNRWRTVASLTGK